MIKNVLDLIKKGFSKCKKEWKTRGKFQFNCKRIQKLRYYFNKLGVTLGELNLNNVPTQIFNMDEIQFFLKLLIL